MNSKHKMLAVVRAFKGCLKGSVNGKNIRFKPAVNKHGELYVSIFLGKSTHRYYSLPLDEWASWADQNVLWETL